MIFAWSREAGTWELLADTGELLGRAWSLGGGVFQAEMTELAGRKTATATSLARLQGWMMDVAAGVEP
jgi:hypothetical protein